MGKLRAAIESHDVVVHTVWASVWTGVLLVLTIVLRHEQPQAVWVLALLVLVGMYHVLFRTGRWADRRGAPNALTRRSTWLAWLFPVAFPAFVVWEAVAG